MTTALVTGATGTIGSALVRRLLAEGIGVRALARSDAAAGGGGGGRGRGRRGARGDVLDADTVRGAARGCEFLFHVAGRSGLCLPDAAAMERLNVEGATTAVRAAADAGVRRVVLTSSAATLGEAAGAVGDERTAHRGTFLSRYEASKHRAERLALAIGRDRGVEVVSVNPASVQGAGRTTGSARLLLDAVAGRLPVVVDAWLSLVDVEDCATGHVLAARRGIAGERYVLAGSTMRVTEAFDLLDRLWGLPRRPRPIPAWTTVPVGWIGGAFGSLTGRRVRACPEAMRTLRHGHRYDGSRATRDLGLPYTPIEETLRRALAWYAERGLVPAARPRG
ncbi:MAG: NAD-dependent epimerase/dehydratase family protein [Actinomycetota bacterium]